MDLVDRVSGIVDQAVSSVVLKSFRSLQPGDIQPKDTPGDPDDVVTIADKAAERFLIDALVDVVPGAAFVGEEAVCEDPALLTALSAAGPVWLIDPIDGTKNFANGNPDFGVMVALVERGCTRASWIAVPAARPSGYAVVAIRGKGTWMNGARVERTLDARRMPRGTIHTRLMPAERARDVLDRLDGKYEQRPSTGSAATEYAAIIRGEKEFVVYYRVLPWDHAAGALAVTEAGGAAVHLNGSSYSPLSTNQVTIVAASPALAEQIRISLVA